MTPDFFAENYFEIAQALEQNDEVRDTMLDLIEAEPIVAKVLVGGNREDAFRPILTDLATGLLDDAAAAMRTRRDLPPQTSPHGRDNRVFSSNWEVRLVRTQVSRFYNHAVLAVLKKRGAQQCYVPHSAAEANNTACTMTLAGRPHDVDRMLDLLVDAYSNGNFNKKIPRIPDHPHCSHVITPIP